jgi:hypothetical protein
VSFTIASLIAGLVMGVSMRSWNSDHPTTAAVPEGTLRSEINLAAIAVRGDAGGLFFAIGYVVILLALPQLRWFPIESVVCAVAAGYALIAWRQRRESARPCRLARRIAQRHFLEREQQIRPRLNAQRDGRDATKSPGREHHAEAHARERLAPLARRTVFIVALPLEIRLVREPARKESQKPLSAFLCCSRGHTFSCGTSRSLTERITAAGNVFTARRLATISNDTLWQRHGSHLA